MEVIHRDTKLEYQFDMKDSIPKERNHDAIYHIVCKEDNCKEDYISDCARRFEEKTKHHNSRDKTSHMLLRHLIEIRLPNDWKIVSSTHSKKENFRSLIYLKQKITIKYTR